MKLYELSDIFAEAFDDVIHRAVFADELDALRLADEHSEGRIDVARDVIIFRHRRCVFVQDARRPGNAVDAEGCNAVRIRMTKQIITVAAPHQHPGTAAIFRSAIAQFLLLSGVVLEIRKRDFLPGIDRRVDCVYDVIDLFVFRLDPSLGIEKSSQFVRLVSAGELSDFFDQFAALFRCDELGGFHRVDQKLQLRQIEKPRAEIVFVLRGFDRDDVETEGAKLMYLNSWKFGRPMLKLCAMPFWKRSRNDWLSANSDALKLILFCSVVL